MTERQQTPELKVIPAEELLDTAYAPSGAIIDRLVGQGIYILAGAPKTGKSWLVLWLANQVSKGEPVWGLKTEQCGVLYISMEDTFQRIQKRLNDTRKTGSSDSFNMISGTTGILGCTDGALVLQKSSRMETTATLDVTGREIADTRLNLRFDKQRKVWDFVSYGGDTQEKEPNPILTAA